MMRFICALCLLFLAVFQAPANARTAIAIGVLPASDALALHVAKDEGLFAELGLDVKLVPFQSALEQSAALRAGAVQGWFTDPIIMMNMHESGVPQHIIATMSHSGPNGRFFGVAVSPRSKAASLDDLKGTQIAISKTTIIEYMLDRMLENKGLARTDVERVDIRQIAVRLQLLATGKTEAAVLPEPLLSLVETKGSRTIADNTALSMPLAITAIRRGALNPHEIDAFQKALAEGMRRVNADPERYKHVMLAKKLLPEEAAARYRMLQYPPEHTPLPTPSQKDLEPIAKWMLDAGLLRAIPSSWDMIDDAGRP